jgi:hypothetical protein
MELGAQLQQRPVVISKRKEVIRMIVSLYDGELDFLLTILKKERTRMRK